MHEAMGSGSRRHTARVCLPCRPVSPSVALGLLLALCCSVVALLGFLFKQRGAVGAPAVQWRHPVRSTGALFANRWWTLGIVVATAAWVFHVAALSLAPISLVQSVIAGGLVLLTPLASRVFHLPVTKRDWIGVAITAAGLALLAATLGNSGESAHRSFTAPTLWLYVGILTVAALACCGAVVNDTRRAGPVLALAAGLLWGASDVTIKAASGDLIDRRLLALLTPGSRGDHDPLARRPRRQRSARSSSARRSRSSRSPARPPTW